jgi:hypothetical protein
MRYAVQLVRTKVRAVNITNFPLFFDFIVAFVMCPVA